MHMEMMTTAQSWLLKACLAKTKEEQQEAVQNWEDQVCMDELDFSSMRLIPYFFHRNQQVGITTKHDKRLKVIYKHWWLRNQHISHELKAVQQALSEVGIKTIIIKGAAIKMHYEKEELRPMSDFDLIVPQSDLHQAIQITKKLGFVPDPLDQRFLEKCENLYLDFQHGISFKHSKNETEFDLHWKFGSRCSKQFTTQLWNHLVDYELIPGAKKPPLAYEVCMILIHAVTSENKDNLNWILDIETINQKFGNSFWKEARQLAVNEKKADLFDYGCSILITLGVYAPVPSKVKKPIKVEFSDKENRVAMSRIRLIKIMILNTFVNVNRIYAHENVFTKGYHLIRKMRYSFIIRAIKRKSRI